MKIGIASDHRGYKLKEELKTELNYELIDYGTNSEASCDYPEFAFKLGEAVVNKEVDFGVAICGSGLGISIACNKVKGVRCAKVIDIEEAKTTRYDNDANIVALSEKTSLEDAIDIINIFVNSPFSNVEKHKRRINEITAYEEN